MRTQLVSIDTDTVPLEGAYYEPDAGPVSGAVQLFHGNCMNFYVGPPRFLPPRLTELGLVCLAYNRRGHDVLSTRASRRLEGGAYQTTAEALADNRYAMQWLQARGHSSPIVIGHSNGGTLAVRHVAEHPQTPALVLLSAHAGGKNLLRLISGQGLWAGERLNDVERQARAVVEAGHPEQLLLLPGWWHVVSAASALDLLSSMPDILALAPSIRCPVLYLVGDSEPSDVYPAEVFAERCAGECEVDVLPQCDHFYNGCEERVRERVARWLAKTLHLA